MDPEHQTLLRPDASDYPAVLRRCSEDGRPLAVTARGNLGVLNGRLLGFFCSVRSPGDAILKTYDMAKTLRHADVTVIGGFQSPMEQECLAVPLRGTASVIVCPARGFNHMRTPKHWKQPVAEGRLLLLSFFDGTVPPQPWPSSVTPTSRPWPTDSSSPTPNQAAKPKRCAGRP